MIVFFFLLTDAIGSAMVDWVKYILIRRSRILSCLYICGYEIL